MNQMMNIFHILDSLLHSKSRIDIYQDEENAFSLYMIDRWISMYSPDLTNIINETSNRYWMVHQLKEDQYEFLYWILPQLRKKKIYYIKKNKEKIVEKKEEIEEQKQIAQNLELSQRELNEYQQLFSTN